MKTIKEEKENIIIIKHSKFIGILKRLDSLNDVEKILLNVKDKYPNATHYPYAYIYDEDMKETDDKEPSSTAGIQILNILKYNNLNHIICIVVRYFGGIKLGVGPLSHAYSKTAKDLVEKSTIVEQELGYKIELSFNYKELKEIDYILSRCKIISKEYNTNINYIVLVNNNILNKLSKYNYKVLEELYIDSIS